VKSKGGCVTVSVYVAECDFPPPVPVIVTGYVPVGVDAEVDIVMVLVNVGLPEEGLKPAVAPLGRPDAERLTDCVAPLVRVTVTVA